MFRRILLPLTVCLSGVTLAGGKEATAFTLTHAWMKNALTLTVTPSHGKRIRTVEFWDFQTPLSKITVAPYRLTLKYPFGCHNYHARITYDNGLVALKTFNLKYCADPPPVPTRTTP